MSELKRRQFLKDYGRQSGYSRLPNAHGVADSTLSPSYAHTEGYNLAVLVLIG
jgi:hypothetical protein